MDIQQEEPQYGTVLQWPTEFNMTFFDLVTLLDHSTDTDTLFPEQHRNFGGIGWVSFRNFRLQVYLKSSKTI